MFSENQERLLDDFANLSDELFRLEVISTDSFTGEIGEYIACRMFDLKKSSRVTQAVDGVCKEGKRYQVKSKIAVKNFNYSITKLEESKFDYLVVVYFDEKYNPIGVVRIPSHQIKENQCKITASNIQSFESIDVSTIKLPIATKRAINNFADVYSTLEKSGIIRSRRIVGDIGEFYACKRLNLLLTENRNEKGIDAKHDNGLTFEIKTRRVYESGRRKSETRRLNNLVGKSADYLIVVTLDRSFKCSGMWLVPMKNILNPKSANLRTVNNTKGVMNLIPSQIPWLQSGEPFNEFKLNPRQ